MQEKIVKILFIIICIVTLVGLDILFLGNQVILALYEGLEEQETTTNSKNVLFDAYFEEETKVHHKELKISQGNNVILDITITEGGILEEGVIKIENANFKIDKANIKDKNIKCIHEDSNEIELTVIPNGNVKIVLPIQFERQEAKNIDYFDQENQIKIKGKYKSSDTKKKSVQGQVLTRTQWSEDTDIELTQKIEKYLDLGEKGIVLQHTVNVKQDNNTLPLNKQILTVEVPELAKQMPKEISVLYNGNSLEQENYQLDRDNHILTIKRTYNDDEIHWEEEEGEYKIIYTYEKEVGSESRVINLKANLVTQLYTKEPIIKTDEQSTKINRKGKIITLRKQVTPHIGKGYMYANVNNTVEYKEKMQLEISKVGVITENTIIKQTDHFVDAEEVRKTTNHSITYKSIELDKNNLLTILGEKGNIQLQQEDGTMITRIDKDTSSNEEGKIVYDLPNSVHGLTIVYTTPVKEGNLNIQLVKTICGETGYTKQELQSFVLLENITYMENEVEQVKLTKNIALKESMAKAKLEFNKTNLSTLEKNENVQILITLLCNNENDNLWKNPYVEVQLPQEIQKIAIKSVKTLYHGGIYIEQAMYKKDEKVISLSMKGEQLAFQTDMNEGIQIIIHADITLDKKTPTKDAEVKMLYANEGEAQKEEKQSVQLTSKYGVFVYNQISNYNESKENLESLSEEIVEGNLDSHAEERIAKQEVTIINNYQEPIEEVVVVGRIAENKQKQNSIETELLEELAVSREDVNIFYSEDQNATENSDSWGDYRESVKSYKIVLANQHINPYEKMTLSYPLKIPNNIEPNKTNYHVEEVTYQYKGQEEKITSSMKLSTAKEEELAKQTQQVKKIDGMEINMKSKIGKNEITNDEVIYGGQSIACTIEITNHTGKDLNHLAIKADYENVNFYDEVRYESIGGLEETFNIYIEEVENQTQKEWGIEQLKDGEATLIEYEFSVKEIQEGNILGKLILGADEWGEHTIKVMENPIKKAEVKLYIRNSQSEDMILDTNTYIPVKVYVKNLSDVELNDLIVNIHLDSYSYFDTDWHYEGCEVLDYDQTKNIVKMKIYSIKSQETMIMDANIWFHELDEQTKKVDIHILADLEMNHNSYISNALIRTVYQGKPSIEMKQEGSVHGEYIKDGDQVTFTTTITNTGVRGGVFTIEDEFHDTFEIINAYYEKDGIKQELSEEGNIINFEVQLDEGEQITLVIETRIYAECMEGDSVSNKVLLSGMYYETESNEITYKRYQPSQEEKPEDQTYSISGSVWLDKNKNGAKDAEEEGLKGIKVILLDATTGEIVKDKNGSQKTISIQHDGNYVFENLERNRYMVVFEYDDQKYTVTEYQKTGVNEQINSDVIAKNVTIEGEKKVRAITDMLILENQHITNINAGFCENKIFDLSLQKAVKKVIVQNTRGTSIYEYNDVDIAKVELSAKEIEGSNILIEYSIKVKNEGEIAGYVTDVLDYIPKDLTFRSEINKDWYISTDGILHNQSLTNHILAPGQSKELTLMLTKTITTHNIGLIHNTAEIGKSSNPLGQEDIDSTPGNNQKDEDDLSSAQVIISISTGRIGCYISVMLISVILFLIGIYVIKGKVFVRKEKNT